MNIQGEHNKKVTFDMIDTLEQKTDKLTVMMGKLVTKDGQNRQFKPQVYQTNRGCGQTRHNYEQPGFQDRFMSDNNRCNTFRGRPMCKQDHQGKPRYNSNYR